MASKCRRTMCDRKADGSHGRCAVCQGHYEYTKSVRLEAIADGYCSRCMKRKPESRFRTCEVCRKRGRYPSDDPAHRLRIRSVLRQARVQKIIAENDRLKRENTELRRRLAQAC